MRKKYFCPLETNDVFAFSAYAIAGIKEKWVVLQFEIHGGKGYEFVHAATQ